MGFTAVRYFLFESDDFEQTLLCNDKEYYTTFADRLQLERNSEKSTDTIPGYDRRMTDMEGKGHKRYLKITQSIFCFAAGSFIGWLYEVAMGFIIWKQYMDRGVLHLPLCVIYGFGALVIMAFLGKRRSLPVIFLYGAVISTAVELGASYVIGWVMGRQLWDYSHWPLHFFQGRISLPSSMLFGFFSMLVIGIVYPLIEKWVGKMPAWLAILLDIIIVAAVAADAAIIFWGR